MDIPQIAKLLGVLAATQRKSKRSFAGWIGQYVYEEGDPGVYSFKIVADLLGPTAVLTSTYWDDSMTNPDVSVFTLVQNPDATVYPLGVGCPYNCFIYSFEDFACANARNLKFYFSDQAIDLRGDGTTGYVMGAIGPNLDDAENYYPWYPCTRT